MAWARMDDGFHDHPKVGPLTLAAVGLWTLCFTWANKQLGASGNPPGFVPDWRPKKFGGTAKQIRELVDSGLWEVVDGGWLFHDFVDYLPKDKAPATTSEVSAARSEAGRRGARARWHPDSNPDGNVPSTPDGKPMPPSRPVPKKGAGSSGDHRPEPWCNRHPQGTDDPCRACAAARRKHDDWRPTAPTLPTVTEALNRTSDDNLDQHGFPADACPICRRDAHGATA